MKTLRQNLAILLLLLPLVWIYTPDTQDWGGDFAAYIAQAENILSGKPIGETGYVYNPDYFRLAPPSYPPGFSLTLVPCIALFGSGIGTLVLYMSILLVLFGWGFYRILRLRFNHAISLVAVLITFYNPWMIRFKIEVIADMPFALLVIWTTLAYVKAQQKLIPSTKQWLLCGFLLALTILTKTLGWVLVIAFALDSFNRFRKTLCIEGIVGLGILLLTSIGLTFTVNHFWLPAPANHLEHFSSIAAGNSDTLRTIGSNIQEYANIYKAFFIKDLGEFTWIGITTASMILTFGIIGAVVSWLRNGLHVSDWVFLGLMGGLLLFPITNGFRYFLPAFVFALGYSMYGLGQLPWNWFLRTKLPGIALLFIFAQYLNGWYKISQLPNYVEGPYLGKYIPLHQKIQEIAIEDSTAIFLSAKPRVFAYMDHVEAFSIRPDLGATATLRQIKKLFPKRNIYIIQINTLDHHSINRFVSDEYVFYSEYSRILGPDSHL